MRMATSHKPILVFPELSYQILGAAFGVFNNLDWGFSEKDYGRALAEEFSKRNIKFEREVYVPLKYGSKNTSRYFADFIVEDSILIELKIAARLGYTHIRQVLEYLRCGGYRLGLLIYFTKDGVKYRRVLNSGTR